MSNHEAGHIVSGINKKIIDFYNQGKITQDVAKDLINTATYQALGYDGNDYECVEQLEGNYCGRCLKALDKVYDFTKVFWDHYTEELPLKGKEAKIYMEDSTHTFDGFCKDCMDEWLTINFPGIPKEEYYKLME